MKQSRILSLSIPLLILLFYANCYAQSSFMALTPGKSSKLDVEKALGPPASQVTERLLEYRKGEKQVYVQYSKETALAIRIQVVYSPSVARSEIVSTLGLPSMGGIRRTNKKGVLEEYFGNPNYIVLTYEDHSQTQISQAGYYSRQLFESATADMIGGKIAAILVSPDTSAAIAPATPGPETRPVDIPSLNANVVSLRFYDGGISPTSTARVYKSRFAKTETNRVGYELILQHPAPGKRIEYSIDSVWHRDGTVFYTGKYEVWIDPAWIRSTPVYALGWDQPGNWAAGSYLVELFIDGRKIASGLFEVY